VSGRKSFRHRFRAGGHNLRKSSCPLSDLDSINTSIGADRRSFREISRHSFAPPLASLDKVHAPSPPGAGPSSDPTSIVSVLGPLDRARPFTRPPRGTYAHKWTEDERRTKVGIEGIRPEARHPVRPAVPRCESPTSPSGSVL